MQAVSGSRRKPKAREQLQVFRQNCRWGMDPRPPFWMDDCARRISDDLQKCFKAGWVTFRDKDNLHMNPPNKNLSIVSLELRGAETPDFGFLELFVTLK